MSAVDLFAGPGGWDVAARDLGIEVTGIELDPDACATRRAAGHETIEGSVLDYGPDDFWTDGLIASPPCQTFSAAGNGAGRRALTDVLDAVRLIGKDRTHPYTFDARTSLVVEPLRWALGYEYQWLAWEQVPSVLPVWEACADVLREHGWHVATGKVHAEQFGVPQTRTRAVLIARRDREVELPTPTHSRFHVREPHLRDDRNLLPWVSMRQALGWTGEGKVGFPRLADTPSNRTGNTGVVEINGTRYRARDFRDLDEPSFVVTSKARSWLRFGLRGRGSEQLHRSTGHPAPTLAFGRDSASWCWADDYDRDAKVGVEVDRITLDEAGILQSFPAGYPWHGRNRHALFGQVANAVPPLLARAILSAVAF